MARKRRAIVHIGVEKTGTTSIQRFLATNRPALKALGIYFPRSLGHNNHIKLAGLSQSKTPKFPTIRNILEITDQESFRRFEVQTRCELEEEIAALPDSVHTLVFSNEHLHSNLLEVAEVQNLRDVLSPYADDVRIIAYLRRQDELAISLFSTRIKGGERWQAPFPPVDGPDCLPYYFDYNAILGNYASVFGAEHVIPRVFERSRMHEGDLVSDFLHALAIAPHPSLTRPPRQNESLSRAALYVLSLLNDTVPPWIDGKWNANRDCLVEILERRFATHEPLTTRQEAEAFYGPFRASNEAVRLAYFAEVPSLFDEDFSQHPAVGSVIPEFPQILDIFSQLWNERSEIARRDISLTAQRALAAAAAKAAAVPVSA